MSPAATTTPPRTQAAILHRVLRERHPKLAMGSIAANYGLTIVDLQAILHQHGYPDQGRMRAAIAALEATPAGEIEDLTHAEATAATAAAPRPRPTTHGDPSGATGSRLANVPVDQIHADPDNPREHLTDIEDLADSIRSTGLLQPIVVRRTGDNGDGRLVVVAGHRRLAAIRHLRWTDVDVIIRGPMRPDHVLAAMLIENGQRADLDPIEEARALQRLMVEHHIESHRKLGQLVGRNQVYVSNRLALNALSAEEQEQVRAGSMKLMEATHRGRSNAGNLKPKGQDKGWHLGPSHDLANKVKARCTSLGHPRGRTVGAMGCGACWESVIRADERTTLMDHHTTTGTCPTCGSNHGGDQ